MRKILSKVLPFLFILAFSCSSLKDSKDVTITTIDHYRRHGLSSTWVYISDHEDLPSALKAVGATARTLVIDQQVNVTDNAAVPPGTKLGFSKEGSFNISAGKTVTINGPMEAGLYQVFFGSGAVSFGSGSVKEVYPQWWGATGNGVTNDRAAIQAAATGLMIGRGTLFCPAGTYVVSGGTINLSGISNLKIKGAGVGSTVLKVSGNQPIFTYNNASNLTISDITFQGDFDTSLVTQANQKMIRTDNGREAESSESIRIENCAFVNLSGDAIRIGPNTRKVIVSNNIMTGGLGFLEIAATVVTRPIDNVTVKGNVIEGSPESPRADHPLGISGSDDLIDIFGEVTNVSISGNAFDLRGTSIITTIANNAVLVFPTAGCTISNVSITGNTIRRANSNNRLSSLHGAINVNGSDNSTGLKSVAISGNAIIDSRHGIIAHTPAANGPAVNITGNSIYDCRKGIWVNHFHDTLVAGNLISNPSEQGIFSNGHRIAIQNNKILNAVTAHAVAIWTTTGDDSDISGNFVQNGAASGAGIVLYGTKAFPRVMGNTIVNHPGTAILISGVDVADARIWLNSSRGNGTDISDAGTRTSIVREIGGPVLAFAVNDATPSINKGRVFKTMNMNPTTITDFTQGVSGQEIKVLIQDGVTTIDFTGTNLKGNAGADWSPAKGDWMECVSDGTNWYCSVHECT